MKIPSTFQLNHDKNVLMNQVSFTYLINYSIILSESNMRTFFSLDSWCPHWLCFTVCPSVLGRAPSSYRSDVFVGRTFFPTYWSSIGLHKIDFNNSFHMIGLLSFLFFFHTWHSIGRDSTIMHNYFFFKW